MFRYSAAISNTSAGVLSAARIGRLNASPKPPSSRLTARKTASAVYTAVFILAYCRAPKYWLTMTDAPIPPPIATQMKILVSEYEAPTAASAPSPT